ncbi:excinuclease ABC subunit UvrA [Pajaroellobacter abortibovis]|uniref:UvrABC system protein A n=1 Tax=Pajaroellobacter abortibovis TaxID=1882918 RepID=A0A1L6MV93_9BACT|nr:excinuclease ABC subunit UvrA [Pajaroellobacter abortibovis]APR99434.1 excinuclease ABC subunit A [Pajaroellobacter abortibovis]
MHSIRLQGAHTHNLQHLNLELHPGEWIALTGPSGSGKSSLALDTLYAEGQRRYVESFSPYARQFLERPARPPMDKLDPVAAAVAVDRRALIKSSRSTLATLTDLEPYLAALFACEAIPTCPDCKIAAHVAQAANTAERLLHSHKGKPVLISYPVSIETPEHFLTLRERFLQEGYHRIFLGESIRDIDTVCPSEVIPYGNIEVIIDRLVLCYEEQSRLQEAIATAWDLTEREIYFRTTPSPSIQTFSEPPLILTHGLICPSCNRVFKPAQPSFFSYNSPLGACTKCRGFGYMLDIDWDKVIPDPRKSLVQGAIRPWTGPSAKGERAALKEFALRQTIPLDTPWERLSPEHRTLLLEGEPKEERKERKKDWFPGVRRWFQWLESRTYKMHVRVFLSRYRKQFPCPTCQGQRLNPTALAYRIAGLNIAEWHALTVTQAKDRAATFAPSQPQGEHALRGLQNRLKYLHQVGLGYLTLNRQAKTLSGGEAQRASLTTALGTALTGTLFVLDEPTIGLHPTDVPPLTQALRELAQRGNIVLTVEHEENLIRHSSRVIELGPAAGTQGGRLLFDGPPDALANHLETATGRAWSRPRSFRVPRPTHQWLTLKKVQGHNLQGIDVSIPLGNVCAICGPSGSGKSTLAVETLYSAIARELGDTSILKPSTYDSIEGLQSIARVVLVDQSPLGRTTRGNAATYTKAWDFFRKHFAAEPASVRAGLTPSHFSFNVAHGRCENCKGEGYERVEMQFLADVSFLCPVCQGKRFKEEILEIRYREKTIDDVLRMTIDEALAHFDPPHAHDPALHRTLTPIHQVGLGYLQLGQPLSSLSGGEAQRLKLARALTEKPHGVMFIIDEPSAGLHSEDIRPVLEAIHILVEEGGHVVLIEHDLDILANADWLIELGPGAGPDGGHIVVSGPPSRIAKQSTKTGQALQAWCHSKQFSPSAALSPIHKETPVLSIVRAREHNLKEVSCDIPHGQLCVITGPSGSGKSSLAFHVIFAEGQRRFMETLTPYARQFLPTLPRANVDEVSGIPPCIALEQRLHGAGAHSTVATVTELAHYLRLLFAKVGERHCPQCDAKIASSSADELFYQLHSRRDTHRKTLYAPAVTGRKGIYLDLFTNAARTGIKTARVDGVIIGIDPPPSLKRSQVHDIDLIVFYGTLQQLDRKTLDQALAWGNGMVRLADGEPRTISKEREEILSTTRACTQCGTGVPELDPRWFSFNTVQGQCEICQGTGSTSEKDILLTSPRKRCSACGGSRLSPVARRVRLGQETYAEFTSRPAESALQQAKTWKFLGQEAEIATAPWNELIRRLSFVVDIGLGYLALDRPASTLSGGEMQRLRLSAQLGSGLTGTLYILDEPTIGLHPKDTSRLLNNLRKLVDTGSTVIVVEHDAETIRAADYVLDLGPNGGRNGGRIMASGPSEDVLSHPDSPTGQALKVHISIRDPHPEPPSQWIELTKARANNLRAVDFRIPVQRMTVVCGVSGSGKSTLVNHVFYPALRRSLGLVAQEPGPFHTLKGSEAIRRTLAVDQSPIGRSPRSTPATFLGVWDHIRTLFASLPTSKVRGYTAARFSFNTAKGGQCPTCQGQGTLVTEMTFLPPVLSPCEACRGDRFESATLDIRYAGKHLGEVLRLSAAEAAELFSAHTKIVKPLQTLCDLGIGYLQLGQGSHTLSGGEAQRLKLAAELTAGIAHEPTLYVLDEPTTGLHIQDVHQLITVFDRLVQRGDTLVIIEHHPDLITRADWVIELGPEAGKDGGTIVFQGKSAQLYAQPTATGQWLAHHMPPFPHP